MKTNKTIKSLLAGVVLASGLFTVLPLSETAFAASQNTVQTTKSVASTQAVKPLEIKTFEDVKKAAAALYNSSEYAPKDIVFKSSTAFEELFRDYNFMSKDFTLDAQGYTVYGRTVEVWSEEVGNGMYENTIKVINDREKEEEVAWNKKMDAAEKYIVANYKLATDYDVVLAVNDFIGSQMSYGKRIADDHPFLEWRGNATTCTGYTDVAATLYKRFGIESRYISGTASWSGKAHAWNAVKVGGNWYYSDATSYDAGDKKKVSAVLMTNAEGSTPYATNFKVSDTNFEMSMAKAYTYKNSKESLVVKK